GFPTAIGITMFANLDFTEILAAFDDYAPGDIVLYNDPYTTGGAGSHLPDINILMPVFVDGELVCFTFAYVHSSDVGGKVAGSLSPSSYEVFQEGMRIPPVKLYKGGELNEEFLGVFLANCRVPKDNWGDIRAMVSAVRLGEARIGQLLARHGSEVLQTAIEDALDYSERRTRAVIKDMPDGVYEFADYLDDDVASEIPVKFCVTITINGSDLEIDFTGTDPQVRSAFNLHSQGKPHPWIVYKIMFLFLTLDPDIPVNAGLMRPLSVTIPEGSVLNCTFPAAIGLRTTSGVRVQDALFGALAQAMPQVVPAAGAGYMAPIIFAEPDLQAGGLRVTVLEPLVGGTGGTSDADGVDARDVVDISNLRNNPVEIVERIAAARVREYGLRIDSGGPGTYRGGLGKIIEFEVRSPECLITVRGQERHRFAPWGLKGGGCGAKAHALMKRAGEADFSDIGKIDSLHVTVGDVVRVLTPGGAGYGDPLARDLEKVQADLDNDLISPEAAAKDYGVVLVAGRIDQTASRTLRRVRASQKEEDESLHTLGPDRLEYEKVWTPEVWQHFMEIIYSLPGPFRSDVRARLWRAMTARAAEGKLADKALLDEIWAEVKGRLAGALQQTK
ncbi:MAG: hydantoinase B/oxoprolinase family protein, partial [Rhodospirillales bacterium]|nr:hydantoinase B/oxoprolinase family protein [Rhodospirillales bacterium]